MTAHNESEEIDWSTFEYLPDYIKLQYARVSDRTKRKFNVKIWVKVCYILYYMLPHLQRLLLCLSHVSHDRADCFHHTSLLRRRARSDLPLIIVLMSPKGSEIGKSTDSRRMAKKIHQPDMQVTKAKAPPA